MKRALVSLFLLVVVFVSKSLGQDIRFSQFYANKLYLNPAMAGSDNYSHVSLNYRNQWPNLELPFVTYSMSYDCFVKPLNGGVGLWVTQDDQGNGALKTTTVSGMYSYYLRIAEEFNVRAALELSFVQKKLDWGKLVFPDQISPLYGAILPHNSSGDPVERNKNGMDFSAGFLGSYRQFYIGGAVSHLAEPSLTFSEDNEEKLLKKYTLHAGFEVSLGSKYDENAATLSPSFLFQKQGKYSTMNYGLYAGKSAIIAGVWFSQNFEMDYDAIILMVGLDNKRFRVAYSFDYALSKLIKTNTGAHEISLSFLFTAPQSHRIRAVRCPRF